MPDPLAELANVFANARLSIASGATIAALLDDPDSHESREAAAQALDGIDVDGLARVERAATALAEVAARLRAGRRGVIAGAVDPSPIGELDA